MTRDTEKVVFTSKTCSLASQVAELLEESVGSTYSGGRQTSGSLNPAGHTQIHGTKQDASGGAEGSARLISL